MFDFLSTGFFPVINSFLLSLSLSSFTHTFKKSLSGRYYLICSLNEGYQPALINFIGCYVGTTTTAASPSPSTGKILPTSE